jgi:hypothetical protein
MLKYMAIPAVLGAVLLGGPSMTKDKQTTSHAAGSNTADNKQPVSPTHVVVDPPLPPSTSKIEPYDGKGQSPEKPLPRFERPEWVIVYITAFYVLIAWWTLRAIKRQANHMELRFNGWISYETAFEPDKVNKMFFGWTWIEDTEWIDDEVGFADISYWKESKTYRQKPK